MWATINTSLTVHMSPLKIIGLDTPLPIWVDPKEKLSSPISPVRCDPRGQLFSLPSRLTPWKRRQNLNWLSHSQWEHHQGSQSLLPDLSQQVPSDNLWPLLLYQWALTLSSYEDSTLWKRNCNYNVTWKQVYCERKCGKNKQQSDSQNQEWFAWAWWK